MVESIQDTNTPKNDEIDLKSASSSNTGDGSESQNAKKKGLTWIEKVNELQ